MFVEYIKRTDPASYLGKCPTDEVWHAWGFAIEVLFRLIDCFDAGTDGAGSHPDVITRLQMTYVPQ